MPRRRVGRLRGVRHGRLRRRRHPQREQTLIPRRILLRLFGRKERYRKGFRRRVAIAIAIASAGAAIAAWQGEEHARRAEELDRDGYSQAIAREQAKAEIRVNTLIDVVSNYASWQAAKAVKTELRAEQLAQNPKLTVDDLNRIGELANAQEALEGSISISPDVRAAGDLLSGATLNRQGLAAAGRATSTGRRSEAIFGLELALRTTQEDLDPQPEFKQSDSDFARSNNLLADTALFILAAFFFTLAQISSRPRAVNGALGLGGAICVAATVLLVLWIP